MFRVELFGLMLLSCSQILTEQRESAYGGYDQQPRHHHHQQDWQVERETREVRVKQGWLTGLVVQPRTAFNLPLVDVFLGI